MHKLINLIGKKLSKSELAQGEIAVTESMYPLLRRAPGLNGRAGKFTFPVTLVPLDSAGCPVVTDKVKTEVVISDVRWNKPRKPEYRMYIGGMKELAHLEPGNIIGLVVKGDTKLGTKKKGEMFLLYPEKECLDWGEGDCFTCVDYEDLRSL